MLAPALISVCLFQFMWTMNDFLGPLIYLSSVDKYPVSLALKLSIDTTEAFEWNRILAMSVLTIAPALIVGLGIFLWARWMLRLLDRGKGRWVARPLVMMMTVLIVIALGFLAQFGIQRAKALIYKQSIYFNPAGIALNDV